MRGYSIKVSFSQRTVCLILKTLTIFLLSCRIFADISVAPNDLPGTLKLNESSDVEAYAEIWEENAVGERSVRNVSVATLTPVLPDPDKATGAAVIVAPGGAFMELVIDGEGYQVARWLSEHGIAAFVLKYRLDKSPENSKLAKLAMIKKIIMTLPKDDVPVEVTQEALVDAQSAVKLVRSRYKEWGIDPNRVGIIGFSAGAITALAAGLSDDEAARPDFIAPIYGSMSPRPIPDYAPPMFVAIALDDRLFSINRSMGLIKSWREAGRPVEAHLYEKGGHGFGMANKSHASSLWIESFYAWLQDRGLLGGN